jgi:hypothetical protein
LLPPILSEKAQPQRQPIPAGLKIGQIRIKRDLILHFAAMA